MFDMQLVGKTISSLRKEKNMTQMELADRLGISFQAVSNWERGQTMPDIAKLGELAEIFGVTIDELLGSKKSARMVERIIREEPVAEELSTEDFLEMAPLVKPNQAEKLFQNVQAEISLKDLAKAAPFLSENTLDVLARELFNREDSSELPRGLLPFLSQATVDECVQKVLGGGLDIKKIVMAAPFMSKDSLDRLTDQILVDGSVMDLVPLAPFLSKEKLKEAATLCIEKFGFSKVLPFMPFLDNVKLDTFVMDAWKKKS